MQDQKRVKKAKTTKLAVKTNFFKRTSDFAQYLHIAECEKIVCNLKLELLQKELLHTQQKADKLQVA